MPISYVLKFYPDSAEKTDHDLFQWSEGTDL